MYAPGTRGATGWCLEVHDLAISKLVAGRDKDFEFLSALARHGLVQPAILRSRLDATAVSKELRTLLEQRLRRLGAR